MSAPPRGPHGGGTTSGRSTPPPGSRSRGAARGSTSSHLRGRGGRGRGAASTTNPKAEGFLQGLQTGNLNKRGGTGNTLPGRGPSSTPRGPFRSTRGRGAMLDRANAPSVRPPHNNARANPSQKDFMMEMTTKFQDLKQRREGERAKAIRDGFLADPDKKTSLDKAITPVGTCTEMCPEFERVERIVQNMVEKPEKMHNEATGRDMPAEERMVKRFRRSAAGYDEQLPSDIRTPRTLQATLDYLLNDVVGGGEQLAAVHKFVWDRTRGIRNDFSIQQVSRDEDVRIAVDCFERIARFHILSLHQLSNPDNLSGEGFDAHQEREQLNNTLLSLMYYYDDNRDKQPFPNEAEFRTYCIIFELQSSHPDLEDRMQSWPPKLLNDKRVQTAFRLYSAATNTLFEQGPLKPTTPFSIAQGNSGAFWKLLKSKAVSYMMSCVAEIYFGQIRYMTLQNLWESHKGPSGQQIRNQEWTLDELTGALAFDNDEQTLEFCQGYGLGFKTSADGIQHLDFTSQASPLEQSSTPNRQVFSHGIVEAKRYRRSLVAVINGIGVARAIREGLIETDPLQDGEQSITAEEGSREGLFFPEPSVAPSSPVESKPASIFNPEASIFTPGARIQPSWLSSTTSFGQPSALTQFTPPTSMSSISTSIAPSASSFPSFLSTSSNPSTTSFQKASTQFVRSLSPKLQDPATSSTTSKTTTAPSTFSDFKFGQSTSSTSPQTNATSAFSFRQPSALRQQEGQQQLSSTEKPGDVPIFVPRLPDKSVPITFSATPPDEGGEFSPSGPENKSVGGPPWPDSEQQRQENQEPSYSRPTILQQALPPQAVSQRELKSINDESIPPKPPPSPRPAELELSAVFAPGSPPFSESISTSSSILPALHNTPQPSFSSNNPAPSVEGTLNHPPRTRPESPSLLPSQYPAPFVPPKIRKPIQPKVKELRAVSPRDPTPRDSSPLRERPVIFGDNANSFRQSAAFAINPPPRKTAISADDRDAAAESVAWLAILQPAGLMQEYLQFTLPDLLKPILRQREEEKPILTASKPISLPQASEGLTTDISAVEAAHHQLLAKKYFQRWRANTYRRVMNRRARDRRQKRIDALEQEKQKRMRGEAELEAILRAKKEKERIQAEMLARSANHSSPSVPNGIHQTAGQKRKNIHVERKEDSGAGDMPRKIAKGHHRSRTMGHVEELYDSSTATANQASANTTTPQSRSSLFSSRSLLNGPRASPDSRRSLSGRKDTTRTDYFKLKALGIDPDTPIVPDTKASLERKRQFEEDIAIAAARTRARTLSSTIRPVVPHFSPQGTRAHGIRHPWTLPNANMETKTPTATNVNEDDDLLRQIREVRDAMSEGTEWFKTQAVNLEKEIEVHEELRRSASQASSRSSPHPSASGLARANGFEYLPGPEIAGRSLSRTEQRIRRTGAHGLATKPVGGSGDYLAVAMSRESAAKLNLEKHSQHLSNAPHIPERIRKSKEKTGKKESRYIPQQSDEDSEDPDDDTELERLDHYHEPCTNGNVRASEMFRNSTKPDKEVVDEYASSEQDDDDVQESLEQREDEFEGGDTEDLYEDGDDEGEQYEEDEEGEEDDEDEGEEADEVGSLPYQQGQKGQGHAVGYWLRSSVTPERGLNPNGGGHMMSRASSGMGTGTGASADDALVLDSD